MKHLKTRGGEYEPPMIEVLFVIAEQGFAGSDENTIPGFDEPEPLSWTYGDSTE